jgi:hypothetical protein
VIRAARYTYAVVAWAMVAAMILQVFFIGLGLFDGSEKLELHRTFGWILHLVALIVPITAALAAAGRARILLAIVLAAMVWVVPILAALRSDAPLVAAFHPVGALLTFWLATVVARGASGLVRATDTSARTALVDWTAVAVLAVLWVATSFGGPS